MKPETILAINDLIDHCYVSPHMHAVPPFTTGKLYLLEAAYYGILREDTSVFDSAVIDILEGNKSINETTSRKAVANQLFEYIHICKRDQKCADSAGIKTGIVNPLLEQPLISMEVFHRIHGLSVSASEPIKIGIFTFYNYQAHKKHLIPNSTDSSNDINRLVLESFDDANTLVSVTLKLRDTQKARELAEGLFDYLQSVFRYLILFMGEQWDIGISNYNGLHHDDYIIRKDDKYLSSHSHTSGARHIMDLQSLLAEYQNNKINPEELIENVGLLSELSPSKQRVLKSINLLGRAIYDAERPIGFLQGMMAVEALLQMNTNQLVNQSISAQICEYSAFILGGTLENRIAVETEVKRLYGVRSALAHGGKLSVESLECKRVLILCKRLIDRFLTDPNLSEIKNDKELKAYIQKMRYS